MKERDIILLEEARQKKLTRYYTGLPCKNGHLADRSTANRYCTVCSRNAQIEKEKNDPSSYPEKLRRARDRIRKERKENPDKYREIDRRRKRTSVDAERAKKWRSENREKVNRYFRERYKNKEVKVSVFMRKCLHRLIVASDFKKTTKTEKLLGYSSRQMMFHLEKQFDKNMSWDNYGEYWHIDHILPLDFFIKQGILEPSVINALSNIRPYPAKKNIAKWSKRETLL